MRTIMEPDGNRRLLLDGATGTNLYLRGLPRGACVEEWVLEHPDAARELQRAFVSAGSDIIYAPTFSANRVRLERHGQGEQVRSYCQQLVSLARESAGKALVAGDLSPAGLMMEPYGDASFDSVVEIYEEQAQALADAGVDLFVIETMISVPETRAAVLACRKYGKPVFVTMTLGNHGRLYMGGNPACALITMQSLGVSAFGFNCAFGPGQIAGAIRELAPYARIPLIAKPNAGEPNPLLPDHYDIGPAMMKDAMRGILDAGASIIGGCCGSTPEHIAALRSLLDEYAAVPLPAPVQEDPDAILLSSENELFILSSDQIELSEPIPCQLDMADSLLDAADEGCGVLLIQVDTPEEARQFAMNAHMAKLPVCFSAGTGEALECALRLYQGRCMVDRNSPAENLEAVAGRYGAVIY